MVTDIEEIQL